MTDVAVVQDMREGDIFRWSWIDPDQQNNSPFGDYHGKSRIAIFKDGTLYDTYWFFTADGRLDPTEVTLTFWANIADLEEFRGDATFYKAEDIVDLRHSNNSRGPVYLRKGATKDRDRMTSAVLMMIEKHAWNAEYSHRRMSEGLTALKQLLAGTNLDDIRF